MAKDNGDKPKADKKDPVYTVVEVDMIGGRARGLKVLEERVEAKTQEAAMDAVWDARPADRKKVHLGAFLANSFHSTAYDAEEVVVPKKQRLGAGLPSAPASTPAAVAKEREEQRSAGNP